MTLFKAALFLPFSGKKVVSCENPAVSEAHCLILGEPSVYSQSVQTETSSVLVAAMKHFTKASEIEGIFFSKTIDPKKITEPFWFKSVSWRDDRFRARFGHQYLSLHCNCDPFNSDKKYPGFKTFRKTIKEWLELQNQAMISPKQFVISKLGFCYKNDFLHDIESFNPNEFYNTNIYLDIQNEAAVMHNLSIRFFVSDEELEASILGELDLIPIGDKIRAEAKFTASVELEEDLTIADIAKVIRKIADIRTIAKDCFFSFTKKPIHELLATTYVEDQEEE